MFTLQEIQKLEEKQQWLPQAPAATAEPGPGGRVHVPAALSPGSGGHWALPSLPPQLTRLAQGRRVPGGCAAGVSSASVPARPPGQPALPSAPGRPEPASALRRNDFVSAKGLSGSWLRSSALSGEAGCSLGRGDPASRAAREPSCLCQRRLRKAALPAGLLPGFSNGKASRLREPEPLNLGPLGRVHPTCK